VDYLENRVAILENTVSIQSENIKVLLNQL